MDRYTSNPVDVLALRYEGPAQIAAIVAEVERGDGAAKMAGDGEAIIIETQNGPTRLVPGDWLIQGVEGDYYPCKDATFQKKYRPAGGGASLVDADKLRQALHHLERAPNILRQMVPGLRLDKCGVEEALAILRGMAVPTDPEANPPPTSLGTGMPAARRR